VRWALGIFVVMLNGLNGGLLRILFVSESHLNKRGRALRRVVSIKCALLLG
jgi:hypothetical protein